MKVYIGQVYNSLYPRDIHVVGRGTQVIVILSVTKTCNPVTGDILRNGWATGRAKQE